MSDIASQLRTARTDAGLDIATAEYATKIRAKYLRALESGDWTVLPEETSAKSFLRTYADYLGLDGRELVEVFKAGQAASVSPASYSPSMPPEVSKDKRSWRRWLIAALIVALIVGLFLIGSGSGSADGTVSLVLSVPLDSR